MYCCVQFQCAVYKNISEKMVFIAVAIVKKIACVIISLKPNDYAILRNKENLLLWEKRKTLLPKIIYSCFVHCEKKKNSLRSLKIMEFM